MPNYIVRARARMMRLEIGIINNDKQKNIYKESLMEEKFQADEGLSLLDILKLLLSKIKLLILVVLIGAIAGGAFAIWRTVDINYYGTTIEFYVNPEKPKDSVSSEGGSQYGVYGAYGRHVMDNMIKLLESESFTEKLILNNAPLPEKGKWVNLDKEKEVALDLDNKINKADKEIQIYNVLNKTAKTERLEAETLLITLREEWDKAVVNTDYSKYSYNDLVYEKAFTDPNFDKPDTLTAAYNSYDTARKEANLAETLAREKQALVEELTETALEAWRETSRYKQALAKYEGTVSYSYLESGADLDDANNLARSFIYVNINVLNDQDFANDMLGYVKNVLPVYVEANMAVPDGYSGTNCQRITRDDGIHQTDPGYTRNQAIKYALLAAAVALVVACVVIIIIDRSDKRLRDYEIITKKFDLPVLGVVPTIESIAAPNGKDKKKNNTEAKK